MMNQTVAVRAQQPQVARPHLPARLQAFGWPEDYVLVTKRLVVIPARIREAST